MQLVFCIACLSMAGWTWMRFSYAWPTTARDIIRKRDRCRGEAPRRGLRDHCRACGFAELTQPYLAVQGKISDEITVEGINDGERFWGYISLSGQDHFTSDDLQVTLSADATGSLVRKRTFVGRLACIQGIRRAMRTPCGTVSLDTTVSRFHPGTIAGFVVGAMGVFIFGLYLRAWLRERKALASELLQDRSV
jgi:hypothetical protein